MFTAPPEKYKPPPRPSLTPWVAALSLLRLTHGNCHVDAQVAVVGEQLRDRGVEHQAVRVHDRRAHAFVNGSWCGLPGQPSSVTVQF